MTDTTTLIHVRDSRTRRIRQVPASDLANLKAESTTWEQISDEEAHADARYVRNAGGAVHSIPSADLAEALAVEGTEEISEDDARTEAPDLFGLPA